jgi:hypothetical protein
VTAAGSSAVAVDEETRKLFEASTISIKISLFRRVSVPPPYSPLFWRQIRPAMGFSPFAPPPNSHHHGTSATSSEIELRYSARFFLRLVKGREGSLSLVSNGSSPATRKIVTRDDFENRQQT